MSRAGLIKTLAFIVISPALGMFLGIIIGVIVYRLFQNSTPRNVDKYFRKGQLVSAALYSLGHGGNDAQKTMGIIAITLYSAGLLGPTFHIPFWVVIACNGAIALGTLMRRMENCKNYGEQNNKAPTC